MEVIQSEKNRDKLVLEGHMYLMDKKSRRDPPTLLWRCDQQYKKIKCLARLHTQEGRVVKRVGSHCHGPNFARVEALKAVREIKQKAQALPTAVAGVARELIAEVQANVSAEAAAFMPATTSLIRSLQRDRHKIVAETGLCPLSSLEAFQASTSQFHPSDGLQAQEFLDSSVVLKVEPVDEIPEDGFDYETEDGPGGGVGRLDSESHDPDRRWSGAGVLEREHHANRERCINRERYTNSEDPNPSIFQNAVWEIRMVNLTTKGMAAYRRGSQTDTNINIRATFSDTLLGHWTTEGHGPNQVVQLIQYDSLDAMLSVRREMERHEQWQTEGQSLEDAALFSTNTITTLTAGSPTCFSFLPSDSAVYELQTLPVQTKPLTLGADAILVACFQTLYGLSGTEYRLLRYSNAAAAFSNALHTKHNLPPGSETRLMVPLPSSSLR